MADTNRNTGDATTPKDGSITQVSVSDDCAQTQALLLLEKLKRLHLALCK